MSYEFNSNNGGAFSRYPNPFKLENIFLLLAAVLFLGCGFSCVLHARDLISDGESHAGYAGVSIGIFMLSLGVKLLINALSQLRFLFGPQSPRGLAEENVENAVTEGAAHLMETLRRQGVVFPEPTGPLNGILYSMVKKLIIAPVDLQLAAQKHFLSLTNALMILASLCISWTLLSGDPHEGLMSWVFLPLSGLSLYQLAFSKAQPQIANLPIKKIPFASQLLGHFYKTASADVVMARGFSLAVFACLGPVIVPYLAKYLPNLNLVPMWSSSVIVLSGTALLSVLFLWAVGSQIDAAEQTGVACEMGTISMNCPPAQLWGEVGREFQRSWEQSIPNRRYANVIPSVSSGDRGEFHGHLVEETQPMPKDRMIFASFSEAIKQPHGRILVLMSAIGLLLVVLSSALAYVFVTGGFLDAALSEIWKNLLTVIALSTTAVSVISDGHMLWSRMHFTSKITWLEVTGAYQKSVIDVGNTFRGYTKSSSTITRIEDATIRIYSAEIETVSFGKDGQRSVVSMSPCASDAAALSKHLTSFALSQSSVAVPTSSRDLDHTKTIAQMDQSMQSGYAAKFNKNQAISS